ncbi:winged helix-turn-helix domain-containing protein [Rubricoccus marinus]|uniref:winged helix-turn-helix domain-containing protein n=1 Tax=Rubricoccus marinus TaxID=716817 RepID=UPI000B97F425|nr:transcriptional regulator [Rubricoccus marinus]
MAIRRTTRSTAASGVASGVPDLDPVIHQRVRLGIVSALAAGGATSFTDLKAVLELTDGNLSVHARKLEEAGYLRVTKSFVDRMPHTEFDLTDAGRAALASYLDQMEAVIQAARP